MVLVFCAQARTKIVRGVAFSALSIKPESESALTLTRIPYREFVFITFEFNNCNKRAFLAGGSQIRLMQSSSYSKVER